MSEKKTNGYMLDKKRRKQVEVIVDKLILKDEDLSDTEIKLLGIEKAKILVEILEDSTMPKGKKDTEQQRWDKISQRIKDIYEIF